MFPQLSVKATLVLYGIVFLLSGDIRLGAWVSEGNIFKCVVL